MGTGRNNIGESQGKRTGRANPERAGYRELALQLDPEADLHEPPEWSEAEKRGALPWRCQIVRIEEGGELDRMLAGYLDRWKRRTGRKIPTAVAVRGLLRIALLRCGCREKAPNVSRETRAAKRRRLSQLDLFGQGSD